MFGWSRHCAFAFQGGADNLNSAFHLSYNMIMNLMRVEDIKFAKPRHTYLSSGYRADESFS